MNSGCVFTSLTHGLANDCRQANAKLKETLENYNFGAFLIEQSCCRCPNNDCNTSFLLILQQREFLRLKRQVGFDVRPNFLVHQSFREIIDADKKIRLSLLGENSIGIQVGPEMVNKYIDASPPSSNSYCQTDFKIWTSDVGGQTDVVVKKEVECQRTPEKSNLSFSTIQHSDSQPSEISTKSVSTETTDFPVPPTVSPTISPLRTMEVQEEDDDIIFIEHRAPAVPDAPREVKEEPTEIEEPVVTPRIVEIKEEPMEELVAVHMALPQPPQLSQRSESMPASLRRLFDHSLVSPTSSSPNSTTFYSPSTTNSSANDRDTPGSSAKRQKLSEVEMCQMCWTVSYFTPIEDYCRHVLDCHISIHRFKCNVCEKKLSGTMSAYHHAQAHIQRGQGDQAMSVDDVISPEVSEDHLRKFLNTAISCYPDRFRNTTLQELTKVLTKMQ